MKTIKDLKTFENACTYLGLDAQSVIPDFSSYPDKDREAMIAHAKLVIIVKAANKLENNGEEWIPNFNDSNPKYEPWFDLEDNSDGSSGFRYYDFADWRTHSLVGSRLCFISREACKIISEQFIDLYRAYFK